MKKNLRFLLPALIGAFALTADLSLLTRGTCFDGALITAVTAALALVLSFLLLRAADGKKAGRGGAVCALIMALARTVSGIFAGGNTAFPMDYIGVAAVSLCGSFLLFRSLTALCFSCFDRAESGTLALSRWKIALILFACTLPYFLITWPGAVHPDTYDELQQVMGTLYPGKVTCGTALVYHTFWGASKINGFQPVLHTLLVGGLYALFHALGNGIIGITLFLVLQSMTAALVVSGGIDLLRRMGAGKKTLIAVILFYALFPLFPDYFVTTMKDSAFGIALLSMLIFAAELIAFPEETVKRPGKLIGGALSVLLTGLFRSYGLAIAVIVFLIVPARLIKVSRGAFVRGTAAALTGIALCAVTLYVIYPACGILSAPPSEKRSLLFQGAALYQKEYPDEMIAEDRMLLSDICGMENIGSLYNPLDADKVKTNALLYRGDLRDFDALCLRLFRTHPGPFLRAALTMEADYLTTDFAETKTDILLYGGDHAHDRTLGNEVIPAETEGYVEVSQGKYTLTLSHYMKRVVDFLTKIPGIALLFECGTYLCFAFIALAYQTRGMREGKILPLVLILFGISLVCSPIGGSSRYAFPIYLCSPLTGLIAARMPKHHKAGD